MRNVLVLFLFVAVIFSCKKADSELPTISEIKVNGSASTVLVSPGESINVAALISDNEELNQFKIDIHHDFDGHSHKSMTTRYAEIRIKDISGASYNLNENFSIPENASSGTYHGTIRAVDKEGNQSENRLFYFDVIRPEQPTINLTLPTSIEAGNNLNISGTVNGNVFISQVFIKLVAENTGNSLYNQTFNLATSELLSWDPVSDGAVSINIPVGTSGKLKFRLRVEDINGNNTIFEQEINVN